MALITFGASGAVSNANMELLRKEKPNSLIYSAQYDSSELTSTTTGTGVLVAKFVFDRLLGEYLFADWELKGTSGKTASIRFDFAIGSFASDAGAFLIASYGTGTSATSYTRQTKLWKLKDGFDPGTGAIDVRGAEFVTVEVYLATSEGGFTSYLSHLAFKAGTTNSAADYGDSA